MLKPPTRKTLEIDLAIEAVLDLSALLSRSRAMGIQPTLTTATKTVVEKTGAPGPRDSSGKTLPPKKLSDPSDPFQQIQAIPPTHRTDHITPQPPIK